MDLRVTHLVEPDWLETHLDDERIRIVDMRGAVETRVVGPGVQEAEYRGCEMAYGEGHIPGAVYLDWTRDIIDVSDPTPVQIAPPERFRTVMEGVGIGDTTQVIAYDDHPTSQFATRLWWALRYYGHDNVRVLSGGWNRWRREGRPVSTAPAQVVAARFTPRVRAEWRATVDDLARVVGSDAVSLVDARDEAQFRGTVRRGPRGGHVPGALHLPRERLVTPDGEFRPEAELRAVVEEVGLDPQKRVIAYCNGGVAATSVLFTLDMLGFRNLANYDGSWNEWSGRDDLPTEKA